MRTIVFLLAMLATASAQSPHGELPTIVPLKNDKGEVIGTATLTAHGTAYLRDLQQKFIATVVTDPVTKKKTFLDYSGNVAEPK